MADIDLQRNKGGMGWLWWILGLVLLALVIWWVLGMGDDDEVVVEPVPAVTPMTTPEPIAQGPLCVAQALSQPMTYVGQTMGSCELQVTEVPTNRGFWVEENGQRMFALIIDGPQEEPKDINPGQTIRMSEAVLRDRAYLPQLEGEPIDADTQRIIDQDAEYFLVVHEDNIEILTQGTPQPGTDPAQTGPGTGG